MAYKNSLGYSRIGKNTINEEILNLTTLTSAGATFTSAAITSLSATTASLMTVATSGISSSNVMVSLSLVIPTSTTDPSSPVDGQMYFNKNSKLLKFYIGNEWRYSFFDAQP